MTRRNGLLGAIAAPVFALFPALARGQTPLAGDFAGRWGGFLGPPASGLRIVLEIDGASTPVLVSVDQGLARIPATGGTAEDSTLDLSFAAVRGRLQVRRAGADQLVGTWSQGQSMPLTLTRLPEGQEAPERPFVSRGPLQEEVAAALAASQAPALGAAWAIGARSGVAVAGLRAARGTASVGDQDLWHIGSITKSMTATLLARLVRAGTLDWQTTVSAALGDRIDTIHTALRDITLHELVTGRSGIATNLPMPEFLTYPRREADARASRLRWSASALGKDPERAPRTGFDYPNSGFVIAATMAEQRTGQSWEALIRADVFNPLGLSSAGFGPPDSAANPSGHRPGLMGGPPVAMASSSGMSDNPVVMGPAGLVHMSLPELARFGQIHAEGAAGRGNPDFLPKEAWRFLHTPPEGSDYACGLIRRSDGSVWHNGSNTLWYAELLIDPATGTGACAAANYANAEPLVATIVDAARQEAGRQPVQ